MAELEKCGVYEELGRDGKTFCEIAELCLAISQVTSDIANNNAPDNTVKIGTDNMDRYLNLMTSQGCADIDAARRLVEDYKRGSGQNG